MDFLENKIFVTSLKTIPKILVRIEVLAQEREKE
jgi:hypothetical protein